MGILDDAKKLMGMTPMAAKPTEPAPYQRPAKDGRTNTGFVKPKSGGSGMQNANSQLKQLEDDEKAGR